MHAIGRSDTTHLFGAPEFFPRFVVRFVLCNLKFSVQCFVNNCLSFCPFSLAIMLSEILRFTDSYYRFWYLQTFLALFCECVILCTWNRCLYIKRYNSQQFISLKLNKNIAQHSNIDKNTTMFSQYIMFQSCQYIMFQSCQYIMFQTGQ